MIHNLTNQKVYFCLIEIIIKFQKVGIRIPKNVHGHYLYLTHIYKDPFKLDFN